MIPRLLLSLVFAATLSFGTAVFVPSLVSHCNGCGGHRNSAPRISDFLCINHMGPYWTLQGKVTDSDSPVEGMVINFGGVLAGYNYTAVVQADGTFSVTEYFQGLQSGTATAQTADQNNNQSNLAMYMII
jgi:hypothetical protein